MTDATRFTNTFINLLKLSKIEYELQSNNSVVINSEYTTKALELVKKLGFEKLEGTRVYYKGDMSITVRSLMTGRLRMDISLIRDM